jgi:PAS domain S-box-containing protein
MNRNNSSTSIWQRRALRYGLAFVAVAAGFGLRVALTAWVGPGLPTYITFYPAVMVAALLAGFGPGLLATALTGLSVAYWILPPEGFHIASPVEHLGVVLFTGMGLFMSAVAEFYRRDRRKAAAYDRELALRESEERLRFALESSHTGAWDLDLADHTAFRSIEHDRIFGYAEALPKWTYEMFLEHVLPEDRAMVDGKFRRAMENQGDWNFECRIRRTDGQVRWIWAAGRHRQDATGAARRMAGIVQDITERKRTEEALASRRKELQVILESVPAMIFYKDKENHFIRTNKAFEDAMGLPKEKLQGQSLFDLYPREMAEAFWNDDKEVVTSRKSRYGIVESMQTPNGTRILQTDKIPYFDESGDVIGVIGFAVDITERKQAEEALQESEERHQLATSVAKEAIWEVNLKTGTVRWNRAYVELFGRPADAKAHGPWWLSRIHPEDRDRVDASFARVLAEGGNSWTCDYRMKLADDSYAFLNDRAIIVRDKAGSPLRAVGAKLNVTERIQAEEALRQSEQRVRLKLDSILSPEGDLGKLELADIIDAQAVQVIMDDFHVFARIPMAIIDLKGRVLVKVGWQDICTQFHRVNPETCKFCIESDTLLSAGVPPGEFKVYKCKNNMWDVATPILMGGKHVGNLFTGQFFFEGELPDRDLFRAQARQYGFDETEYLAALDRVPQLSRETLAKGMEYFKKLADMLSKLGYSNVKLARLLAERDALTESLRRAKDELEQRVADRTAELRAVSLYARGLLEASLDPLVTISPEGRVTDVNHATELATGLPRERLVGSNFSDYFTEPDNASAGYRQVLAQGEVRDYPLTIRHASGRTIDVLYNAVVYHDEAGRVLGVFAAARDVTEHKRVEAELALYRTHLEDLVGQRTAELESANARLKTEIAERRRAEDQLRLQFTVLQSADNGLAITGRDGVIQWVNAAFTRLTGYTAAEAVGQNPRVLKSGRQSPEFFKDLWQTILSGRVWHGELVNKRKDGSLYPEEMTITPVADADGKITHFVAVKQDITARKQAEAVLQKTAADLARSNLDLEQFAYVASHDLQEPLRAVGGYVKLLQHRFPEKLDAKAREYVTGAADGAERMQRLIADLLAFSRVGTRGSAFAPTDLNELLRDALNNLQISVKESGAKITSDPLPRLPVDATQIRQLFQNLIGNAIKFHSERAPEIHVGARQEKGRWLFWVRDNGIGIEPQYAGRIFQIFQRLHTRKQYPGTGIGLAICKKIVERHGGEIRVESEPAHGSTFYFSIPEISAKMEPNP